jgi:hypothetical protein
VSNGEAKAVQAGSQNGDAKAVEAGSQPAGPGA